MTPPSRRDACAAILALSALVFGLDLLWAVLGGSSGSLAYGLFDEPAHLATCMVALLLLFVAGRQPVAAFLVAALVASVAIDLDHLPRYLGWDVLTAGTPRPYSHSALAVALVLAAALATRGRWRAILLGIAFGICAHLLRDVATGPGIPLGAPFWTSAVKVPYVIYAAVLAAAAGVAVLGLSSDRLASSDLGADQDPSPPVGRQPAIPRVGGS